MSEARTMHNTKNTIDRVNRLISIFYYLAICYYLMIYIAKGNFSIAVTILFLAIFALFFLSAEGLRRGKVWGKTFALLTYLLVIFPKVLRAIFVGHTIVVEDKLLGYTFSCLSIYLIVSMIMQKKEKRLTKICVHCCTKLDIDAKVCRYCGRELSEEDVRVI